MAAITERSFRDCKKEDKRHLDITSIDRQGRSSSFTKDLKITAEQASFSIVLICSFDVQTLGFESCSYLKIVKNLKMFPKKKKKKNQGVGRFQAQFHVTAHYKKKK